MTAGAEWMFFAYLALFLGGVAVAWAWSSWARGREARRARREAVCPECGGRSVPEANQRNVRCRKCGLRFRVAGRNSAIGFVEETV